MAASLRIIGIDPGLRRTGWGVVALEGTRLSFLGCGSVEPPPALELGERLALVFRGVADIVARFEPGAAAVEETFVNKDPRSTLKLGQARGAAMTALALAGLPIGEYAPNLIKKSVVGAGHAEKAQIRMMVQVLLPKATIASEDAADALAVAICHAHHQGSAAALERRRAG